MTTIHSDYSVTHTWPEPYEKIDSDEPYHVVTASLVRDMDKSFDEFTQAIESEIDLWPKTTLLGVFPEFFWRKSTPKEVFAYIEELKTKIRPDLALVLGTLEFTLNGRYTNNAIVLFDGKLWLVPKTKVLEQDKLLGLVEGVNPGVLCFPRFILAILICSDLWDQRLCFELAVEQKADFFAVPAWTATRQGNRKYARLDWHSLARTRSTEYSIGVFVADHLNNYPRTDVANATVCFTQADRDKDFPTDPFVERDIAYIIPSKVKLAIERWEKKGLAQREHAASDELSQSCA